MKKIVLMAGILAGALSLGSCIKNEESASVTAVRTAKAAQLNALAKMYESNAAAEKALADANAAKILAEAEHEKAEAEYQKLMNEYQKLKNEDESITIAENQAELDWKLKTEYTESKLEAALLDAEKTLLESQKNMLNAQKDLIDAQNNYNDKVSEQTYKQLDKLVKAYTDASKDLTTAQRTLLKNETKLAEAKLTDEKAIEKLEKTIQENKEAIELNNAYIESIKANPAMDKDQVEKLTKEMDKEINVLTNNLLALTQKQKGLETNYQAASDLVDSMESSDDPQSKTSGTWDPLFYASFTQIDGLVTIVTLSNGELGFMDGDKEVSLKSYGDSKYNEKLTSVVGNNAVIMYEKYDVIASDTLKADGFKAYFTAVEKKIAQIEDKTDKENKTKQLDEFKAKYDEQIAVMADYMKAVDAMNAADKAEAEGSLEVRKAEFALNLKEAEKGALPDVTDPDQYASYNFKGAYDSNNSVTNESVAKCVEMAEKDNEEAQENIDTNQKKVDDYKAGLNTGTIEGEEMTQQQIVAYYTNVVENDKVKVEQAKIKADAAKAALDAYLAEDTEE